MKTLQEKLDLAAKELEPILWELLNEIEGNKYKASSLVLGKALRGVGLELLVLPRDKFLQGEIINYKSATDGSGTKVYQDDNL